MDVPDGCSWQRSMRNQTGENEETYRINARSLGNCSSGSLAHTKILEEIILCFENSVTETLAGA